MTKRRLLALLLGAIVLAALPAQASPSRVPPWAEAMLHQYLWAGAGIGVAGAIIDGDRPPILFAYGNARRDAAGWQRFTVDTVTALGSVTKIFTTNLLAQDVADGRLSLSDRLGSFADRLGPLQPMTRRVTLRQLADFTGGFPSLAPLCLVSSVPGCLPDLRPPPSLYGAADFAAYFRGTVPFDAGSGQPATSLPTAYAYSDYSLGLLGLLLAGGDRPLANGDLGRWHRRIERQLTGPLGMERTFLKVPRAVANRSDGYVTALAAPTVTGGAVTAVRLASRGSAYTKPPRVQVVGGGGSGARAAATLDGQGRIAAIAVTAGGSGYIAPAVLRLTGGGSSQTADLQAVIRDGRIVAVLVVDGGKGYLRTPTLRIRGGRLVSGRDATGIAHIANGSVIGVTLTDGGAGYVRPLAVRVEPGEAAPAVIPIWAPAGALSSTARDMAVLAAAAAGRPRAGDLRIPKRIRDAFALAGRPYACLADDPALADCPVGATRAGLAWNVSPADRARGVPKVMNKDGDLTGIATHVAVIPEAGLGVVVLLNSEIVDPATGKPVPMAARIADSLLYGLWLRR